MPEANSSCGVRSASAHTTTVSARSSDSVPSATRRSRAPATRPSETRSRVTRVPVIRVKAGSPPVAIGGKIVPGAVRGSGPDVVGVTAMGIGCGRRSSGPTPSKRRPSTSRTSRPTSLGPIAEGVTARSSCAVARSAAQRSGSPKSNTSCPAGHGVAAVQCTPMPPAFQASAVAGMASASWPKASAWNMPGVRSVRRSATLRTTSAPVYMPWTPVVTRSL
jgi:hypothetical protein